jgi:hypothetical protein
MLVPPITVEKSSSHHVSQGEVDGDNPCSLVKETSIVAGLGMVIYAVV